MSDPFPVLLVPHVVFRDLLKSMDFVDIVNLSRCSQTSTQIVRNNLSRLKDWTISVVSNKGIFLQKKYEEERCIWDVSKFDTQTITTYTVGRTSLPKTESDRELKKATEYITNLFKSEIHTIEFGNGGTWLLKWINERGMKIPNILFNEPQVNTLDSDDLGYVLRESREGKLMIIGHTKYSFKYTGPFGDFDYFFHIRPNYVTIESLISMKCSRIRIPFTKLTNADLNRFLKHFVNGGSPRLEFMNIGVRDMNEEEILLGLEEYVRRTDNKREYKWKGERHAFIDETYTFNGLEIVTKNGVCASLHIQYGDGYLNVSEFRMAVWPRL